ncbi:helix-turn-helix transcriptional regulator [Paracoccus sp. PAR01]|nr:helix-turn-helix transcriptional regulator [Paracoccus sp. PAR01]
MITDNERQLLHHMGQRIREVRNSQGLTLDQLARLTGISAPALSLIETAKRDPRLTTLARIADALRLPVSRLIEADAAIRTTLSGDASQGYDLGDYQ